MPARTTACPTRSSRWPATSSTGSTSGAMSGCSTPAAAPAASPRCSRERVPDGTVIAVDGSEAMVEQTRAARHHRVHGRPRRADARRAGRRDPQHRHLPLDPRPRAPLRPPARRAASRRAALRPVRRLRQRRQRPGRRSTPSIIPRCAAGPGRGTSPRPRRRRRATERTRASPTSGPGCSRGWSSRRTRRSTSRR